MDPQTDEDPFGQDTDENIVYYQNKQQESEFGTYMTDSGPQNRFSESDKEIFNQLKGYNMRKFSMYDFGLIFLIFALGFLFSVILSGYKQKQKAQFNELLQQF